MKSFQAYLLVLATCTSALVIPAPIAKRDGCTPGLYQCSEDGQHFQQCTAAQTWSVSQSVAAGMACTPGISENPFHAAGDDDDCTSESSAAPVTSSAVVAPPPPATTPALPSSTAAAVTSDPPPPPPPATSTTLSVAPSSTAASTTSDPPPPPPPETTTAASSSTSSPAAAPITTPATTFSVVTVSDVNVDPTTTSSATSASATLSPSDPPPPPPPESSVTASTTASEAPHTTNAAPTTNPSAGSGPTVDTVCMILTADDPSWSYNLAGGAWGEGSGTIGSLPGGKLCVPADNGAGGAMYIGSVATPGPGNTKLEAYFPTTGEANVDVSIVDGWSLAVTCTADTPTGPISAGGDIDLFKTGTCQNFRSSDGVCLNTQSYAVNEDTQVGNFFLPSTLNGQNYCDVWNCHQDYFFPVTSEMSCHVSGSVPS